MLETIKVQNRQFFNIEAHNRRAENSRRALFGLLDKFDLRDFISLPDSLDDGLYRCRVIYSLAVQKVEFIHYTIKQVRTLRLFLNDTIRYEHKYLDRSQINALLKIADADDVLIVQNGNITDTSYANIVLFDGKGWVTPDKPLLCGTKRQLLLDNGAIRKKNISYKDLDKYKHAALINAMIDLNDMPFIPIENILHPLEMKLF